MTEEERPTCLPEIGSPARDQLEGEAMEVALRSLRDSGDGILEALYETYQHFRTRFIWGRGLADSAPGSSEAWTEALSDARELECSVRRAWAEAILARFEA